jgi:bifunctional non-homologous end joining protein LigD
MESERVIFEGREIRLTRLGKELWPGVTKADLISYYLSISDFILPYLKDRPLTLNLFPDGIAGRNIIMKASPPYAPKWMGRFEYYSEHERRTINFLVCNDRPSLVWLANLANIEFNITLSRADEFQLPDLVVFDLDPFEPASFVDAARVALVIRDGLKSLGVRSFVKTSGATGLHVLVGVRRRYGFEKVRECVRRFAAMIQSLEPMVLAELKPVSERKGRVMIDFAQNSLGKTIVAPYSLRPLPGAPVSMPLKWEELEGLDFEVGDFNIRTAQERLRRLGDIMLPLLEEPEDAAKLIEPLS